MTQTQLSRLIKLIETGQEHKFYLWSAWKRKCQEVRRLDHNECQLCKARGKYRRGVIVHHRKHLKDRPDLALSIYDPETKERQLLLVCKQCHEEEHPESLRRTADGRPVTTERWD